ncbi:pseudouridine synthase [Diplocloster agilis]|uniref:Pseudouridine synthase n=1 Tax=Diplocloster agilis TaxID=2850323 RepID=A0A949JYF3_9FIRM|nr:pseudouridine synthase [Diplocloster agilis]MBU9736451.1 pseudouridine synthase [Diplocloster agilis]
MEEVRLNKFLSEAGVCSRREADRLIEAGKVSVDGETAVTGMKVRMEQRILVNGRPVCKEEEMILLVVNKPRGIVCTAEKREKNNIIEYLHYPKRIYPVGRLDKDSEGLLLMTNNGEIVNKIMRSGNRHEKEYVVTVNKEVTEEFVRAMAGGIPILDTVTRKCEVQKLDKHRFRIVLTQGLNRQIRRMCEYLGYRVVALTRVRIMNIRLGNLKPGAYRRVTAQEWRTLQELIRDSSNTTVIEERKNG